jgi:hypothetical protein
MKLLWPIAWSLLGLALPIILLYLIRQRLRIKSVTTLLFWENLAPKIHNLPLWRKLRRLISLLLQLLLLALIVMALARPILPGQSTVASSLILVLDPSVTMAAKSGSGTRWQDAMNTALRRIDAMGFGDETTVILAGDPPRVLSPWTGRKGDLRQVIEATQITPTVTDIRPALRLAQNLELSHPGATIELISDTVWPVPPEKETLKQVKLDLIGSNVPNSGITLFSARPLPAGAGEYQLAIKIEQNTSAPVSGELTVTQNGHLMDVLQVTVPPGQPWEKFWRAQSTAEISFEAKWKPQGDDGFDRDQQATTHLDPVREIKATLVTPPNPFLEVAMGSQTLVKSQRVWPAPATGDVTDLTVFNETMPPSGWSGKNTVLINPPQSGFWGERVGPIDKPLVSEVDKDAPLLRFADLREVQLNNASEFKPAPGAHVYVDSFGKPLIFGHWESEPRWLVITFDLDRSDFVFRTAFPILCANLVQSLRPDATAQMNNVPGLVATQLKQLSSASGTSADIAPPVSRQWWLAIPFWWWFACAALLLLLIEWSLYTRRITE